MQLCQALLECVQDCRMNTPEFRDLMRIKLSLELLAMACQSTPCLQMFAPIIWNFTSLHVDAYWMKFVTAARLGIAYRKVSWRELGLKPSHS